MFRPLAVWTPDGLDFESSLGWSEESGRWQRVAATGKPEPWMALPAFANAHSHLEYFDMLGGVSNDDYFSFIRDITAKKPARSAESVVDACLQAAHLNWQAGFASIEDHSDWPGSAAALSRAGMGGVVYREILTAFLDGDLPEYLDQAERQRKEDEAYGVQTGYALHTAYTVDEETLSAFSGTQLPVSIHVSESSEEVELFQKHAGPIADFFTRFGKAPPRKSESPVAYLNELGLVRKGVQFVHCCAVTDTDIELMAEGGVRVATCPRSNIALKCPPAPVRRMLEAGLEVGLGQDSAASSGPIDPFAEMRALIEASHERDEPLTAQQAFEIATGDWSHAIAIPFSERETLDDVLERTRPQDVRWVQQDGRLVEHGQEDS